MCMSNSGLRDKTERLVSRNPLLLIPETLCLIPIAIGTNK